MAVTVIEPPLRHDLHPYALQHDFDLRRRKTLLVSADALLALIQCLGAGKPIGVSGLPDDARVVGLERGGAEAPPNTVQLLIESETFEPLRTGEYYPPLRIEFTEKPNRTQALEDLLRAILDSSGGDLHKKGPYVHVHVETLREAEKALESA